jgi:hypothetical protein
MKVGEFMIRRVTVNIFRMTLISVLNLLGKVISGSYGTGVPVGARILFLIIN